MCEVIDIGEYKRQHDSQVMQKVYDRMSQPEEAPQDLHKEYDYE